MKITINAYAESRHISGQDYDVRLDEPTFVEIRLSECETREEAEAEAALFPKSSRFRVTSCSWMDGRTTYSAGTRATLAADGVNGGRNETGVKRYVSTIARAEKLGAEIEWSVAAVNAYPSRERFELAIS